MAKAKKFDKDTIMFLRHYGYNLHSDTETRANLREYLRVNYPYEYYMYVDLDIKKKAEQLYTEEYGNIRIGGYIGTMSKIKSDPQYKKIGIKYDLSEYSKTTNGVLFYCDYMFKDSLKPEKI